MAYNPGATFDPGIILGVGEGISRAINQISAAAQKAKTLRSALGAYAPEGDQGKLFKDKLQTMGLAELEGEMLAQAQRRIAAAERRQAEQDDLNRKLKLAELGRAERETTALDKFQGRVQKGMQQPGATLEVPPGFGLGAFAGPVQVPGMRRGLNSRERYEAALESGVPLDRLDDLTRAEANLERMGSKEPRTVTFVKSPTGADIALSPETGAFQYDPYSKAEASASQARFTVEPILDKFDGTVSGYGVKAQFADEAEARAWAEKQNQTVKGGKTATPKSKVELANQLAKEHPDWTRDQIIAEVNKQFAK